MFTMLYSLKASSHSKYEQVVHQFMIHNSFTLAHLLSIDVQKIEDNIWQYNKPQANNP